MESPKLLDMPPPQEPQQEGVDRNPGSGAEMHQREDSSEDEKSDDLADLYVNDEDTLSPRGAIPGAASPVAATPSGKVDSLDEVYEKYEEM